MYNALLTSDARNLSHLTDEERQIRQKYDSNCHIMKMKKHDRIKLFKGHKARKSMTETMRANWGEEWWSVKLSALALQPPW